MFSPSITSYIAKTFGCEAVKVPCKTMCDVCLMTTATPMQLSVSEDAIDRQKKRFCASSTEAQPLGALLFNSRIVINVFSCLELPPSEEEIKCVIKFLAEMQQQETPEKVQYKQARHFFKMRYKCWFSLPFFN